MSKTPPFSTAPFRKALHPPLRRHQLVQSDSLINKGICFRHMTRDALLVNCLDSKSVKDAEHKRVGAWDLIYEIRKNISHDAKNRLSLL